MQVTHVDFVLPNPSMLKRGHETAVVSQVQQQAVRVVDFWLDVLALPVYEKHSWHTEAEGREGGASDRNCSLVKL